MTDPVAGPPPSLPPLGALASKCPDCGVAVGQPHVVDEIDGGCDIARCLVTGLQRLMCVREHDCGRDVWTGWLPGDLDCELLGWMIAPGWPDLNRLYTEGMWDPQRLLWVPRSRPD
ncbi:MAG: hypothetical protein HOY78_44975 [Saccharothrix sp.]|nr:hypothetical protein [Saccharothrix sp.]